MSPYREAPPRAADAPAEHFARRVRVPDAIVLAAMAACAALVAVLTGCHGGTGPAVRTADANRATGHALAAVVQEACAQPYARAAELAEHEAAAEVARLDGMGCPEALRAQTALSEAHAETVAMVEAMRAGQCEPLLAAAPPRCDMWRVTASLVEAGARLQRAVDALESER